MGFLTLYSYLIPVFVFLFRFRQNRDSNTGIIFFYIIYSFLNDICVKYLPISEISKYYMLGVFTVAEYILFAYFLYSSISGKLSKRFILITSICYVVFALVFSFSIVDRKFDSLPASVEALVIITFCVIYFFEQIKSPTSLFLYTEKSFWIVCGLMIYSAGTFFLFLQSSGLSDAELAKYWVISQIGNIIKNLLFAVAFYIKPNKNTRDDFLSLGKMYEI
jgi:hypothetical protein